MDIAFAKHGEGEREGRGGEKAEKFVGK